MNYKVAYYTDAGTRKKNNQDSFAIKVAETPEGQVAFAVICDGMGGLAKGELASKEVIYAYTGWLENYFKDEVISGTFNATVLKDRWNTIATHMNKKLNAYGNSINLTTGTTLSAILMYENKYYIIHVGDSRIYEITENDMVQLTKDQTFVAKEVAEGKMTPEQAKTDSRRSILLQCIGASPVVQPDFISGDIKKDAVYVLCSDGFIHKISNEEIKEKIGPAAAIDENTMRSGCVFLTELAMERKETDNITVLAIKTI